jgi:hypothetical protein
VRNGRVAGLVLACLLGTTGCVGMPDDGPVVETQTEVDAGEELGYFNDPRPPTPGESPADIVTHFLDAQAAIPIQTNTASEYLTPEFAASWRPGRATVTYAAASLPQGSNQITVELDGANRIDARGRWRGSLSRNASELTFSMRRVDGEWRIADAPDALVVPESWFSQAYRRADLYYFDPSARILVPEPVYVPRGEQFVTSLVSALLRGPVGESQRVERTLIPPGLAVDLSVRVVDGDVAEVPLTGEAAVPTQQDAELMVAQLARTLSQDPSLSEFRVTINGEPLALAGGSTTFSIDRGDAYDASSVQSTSLLFGLREGRLVLGPPDVLSQADGPFGAADQGLRSVGVDLAGARVAGVSGQGDRVLVTDVRDPEADVTEVVSGGTDLLPPAWDFADRIWLLDRSEDGARVSVIRRGTQRELRVPGITGKDVRHFLVSRDGSRMVAVVRDGQGDHVVVSRIRYQGGLPQSGSAAQEIAWDDVTRLSVIDIGWTSPTSLAVLHRLGGTLSQLRTLPVDGAPAGVPAITATLQQRTEQLLSTARGTDPVYVATRGGLIDVLSGSRAVVAEPETTFLTYVG